MQTQIEVEISEPPAELGFEHPDESESRVETILTNAFDMWVLVSIRPTDTIRSGNTRIFMLFRGYPGDLPMRDTPNHLDKWKLGDSLSSQISQEAGVPKAKVDVDVSIPAIFAE